MNVDNESEVYVVEAAEMAEVDRPIDLVTYRTKRLYGKVTQEVKMYDTEGCLLWMAQVHGKGDLGIHMDDFLRTYVVRAEYWYYGELEDSIHCTLLPSFNV